MASSANKPESVLQEGHRIIHGPRREQYGHPKKNFADIAKGWSIIFGVEVPPHKVALAMDWLKTCRALTTPDRDSFADKAGYTGCAAILLDIDD